MTWEVFERKTHRRVPQEKLLEAMREIGDAPLDHVADHFGISESTARRKLDGLVAQGLLTVEDGRVTGYARHYTYVGESA